MIRMDLAKVCSSSFVLFWAVTAAVAQVSAPSKIGVMPAPAYAVQAEGAAYADIADLVTIAPVIIDAQISKATKIPPEQSVGVPANLQRMLIEAKVIALIRGQDGVLPVVKFLLDVPKDAKGKIPKLKKARFFMMASQVAGRPGELRLVRPAALVSYSPANDAMVRAITQEAVLIDAPQKITGIASAFYSPGTVIGEGETQIFLTTEKNQPFALSISSRAGQPKKWSVSTSEVIEESAMAPTRYTLMWYRLACGLPRSLPAEKVESAESDNAARAQADYQHVLAALGPCGRRR
jgi:hypothetical protein